MRTSATLSQEIASGNLTDLVSEFLFEDVPFVFGGDRALFRRWRSRLADLILVDPCELVVVGSAALGLSLNPQKKFKQFDALSDVDIAVLSEHYFSEAWRFLRSLDPALAPLQPAQKQAVRSHEQFYVYRGCIATDRLLPILPFAKPWMAARSAMRNEAPTEARQINFRLYKDFHALRAYQMSGLIQLRNGILGAGG